MSDAIDDLKAQEKAEQAGSGAGSEGNRAWIPGIILIVLGLVFLADNYFSFRFFANWWALFILIPAVSNFSRARDRYRAAGEWTHSARSALVGGLILTLVAAIFLFELSWAVFWPLILIILGAGLLLRAV